MSSAQSVTLNSGHRMPLVGLGTFAADRKVTKETIACALEYGYRSIDTAFLYLNESFIGDELHHWISNGKIKREDLFITSKVPSIGNRKSDVRRFLKKTLSDLKLDYLDLYLIHHPFGFKCPENDVVDITTLEANLELDYDTNIEEIWKEMEKQVDDGLVKSIGISNFNSEQIKRIMKVARIAPAVSQVEAHCYLQQKPLQQLSAQYGIVTCAYCPLGNPIFVEEPTEEFPLLLEHPKVLKIAANINRSPAQVLLKYLLQNDMIVIPKSANPERIKQNFKLFDFKLTDKDLEELSKLDRKGDEGRILNFKNMFKGVEHHKEYPFTIPY